MIIPTVTPLSGEPTDRPQHADCRHPRHVGICPACQRAAQRRSEHSWPRPRPRGRRGQHERCRRALHWTDVGSPAASWGRRYSTSLPRRRSRSRRPSKKPHSLWRLSNLTPGSDGERPAPGQWCAAVWAVL